MLPAQMMLASRCGSVLERLEAYLYSCPAGNSIGSGEEEGLRIGDGQK